jgi:hypothetical protein
MPTPKSERHVESPRRVARPAFRHFSRWLIFFIGFQLSPLTPGNDAVINQLPSSLLAATLTHDKSGSTYQYLYLSIYIISNIIGILMMLVNFPDFRRKWQRFSQLRREQPTKLLLLVGIDVLTFIGYFVLGRLITSELN